ncbi:hypothetical protein VTJ49DRAFT_5188 [Mycothermus thermophilus]|uniref:DUF7896 domain-containing protein n=1 Tax=Humicola insolens TaxID=85995 RepID=A0ABR3VL18_HUMIN
MDGQHDVEQIKAQLKKNEQEKRRLMQELSRAQVGSSNSAYNFTGRPGGSAMSRSSTTGLRVQPQPGQQEQSRPMKRSKTTHSAETSARALMRTPSTMARQGSSPRSLVVDGSSTRPWPVRHNLPAAGPYAMDYLGQYSMPNSFLPDTSTLGVVTGREMNVAEFLSMYNDDSISATSPIAIPTSGMPSPLEPEKDVAASYPSLCGSNTSTLDTVPMSRGNSSLTDGASFASQFNQMVRIQSQQSIVGFRPNPMAIAPQASLHRKRSSDGQAIIPYPSSVPTFPTQHQHPMELSLSQSSMQSASSTNDLSGHALSQHLSMERSESARSNSSLKLRAKEALARQNYAAKSRQLQPKPTTTSSKPSSITTPNPIPGSDVNSKTPITKAKYERPRHPKVKCMQCNDHPHGFRGEHELRRHTEAKHKSMVKKWICRDPAEVGIPHDETAVRPLSECNKCSGKKQYGAYYNAAAHLRRTHFNVKPKKGGKVGGGAEAKDGGEKRGGKGGGDWPSMTELKKWMVEVLVPMDQPGAFAVEDGEESLGGYDGLEEVEKPLTSSAAAIAVAAPLDLDVSGSSVDTAAFTHLGGMFGSQNYDLAGINAAALSFPGDLDSLLYPPPLDGPVLDFGAVQQDMGMNMGMSMNLDIALNTMDMSAPSLSVMGLDGYASPGSSTATITKAGFMDQTLPTVAGGFKGDGGADLAELDFDLTFAAR